MAKRERKQRVPVSYETVNQFRGQHDALDVEQIDPNNTRARRVRVLRPNRLRKYLAMKSISQPMCDAGEILGTQWERAGIRERITVRYGSSGGVGVGAQMVRDMGAECMDAYADVQRALGGDRAPYADLLVSVCCYDEGVANTRRLRRALLALAVHYGLLRRPQCGTA